MYILKGVVSEGVKVCRWLELILRCLEMIWLWWKVVWGSLEVGESLVVVWYGMRVVGGFQIV